MRISSGLLALLWLFPVAAATSPPRVATLVTGAHVIDMREERVLRDHAVLVRDGRIAWVGPVGQTPDAADAEVIDAGGAYLAPGLIDAHVHLSDPLEYPVYLAAGVTTVFEPGALDHRSWVEALEAGQVAGPRLISCGPTVWASTADEARKVVDAHHAAGYDCIKIYDDMSAEVFAALAGEARRLGLRSAAHIPRNLTWDDMLTAAPDAVAHAEEFLYSPCCTEDQLARIARTMRERGIALITTLTTYDNITAQAADLEWFLARQPSRYYPPVEFRGWTRPLNRYAGFDDDAPIELRRLFGFQQWLVDYLHDNGVRIVAGTDAGNTGTFPGVSLATELRWLVEAGLSPYEALASATVDAAAWIGREGLTGTIAPGSEADLVLLAANPLDDVSNVRFVRGVMARGTWFDRDRLHAMREGVAAALTLEAELVRRVDSDSVEAALEWLAAQGDRPRLLALDELAYQKLKLEDAPREAVRLFRANARLYPEQWIPQAGLAEGLLAAGDRDGARAAARRAIELAPDRAAARAQLAELGLSEAAEGD